MSSVRCSRVEYFGTLLFVDFSQLYLLERSISSLETSPSGNWMHNASATQATKYMYFKAP